MNIVAALSGKNVLVTGSNRGIGACFVDALMDAGVATVYAAARDLASLEPAQAQYGDRLVPVALDITDAGDVADFVDQHDDIDLLISNAGRRGGGSVLALEEDEVRDLLEVHLMGPWRLAKGLAPQVRERRGGIIFVHSTAALAMSRGGPFYSASKAAGMMMAFGMRDSLEADGVRVSSVFPGFTNTDIIRDVDIIKASPRDVADRSLEGWAAGEACIFPDRYAELIHETLVTNMQGLLDDPRGTSTEVIGRYAAGG